MAKLEELYARAVRAARFKGLGEEAEDFAGWLIQGYLEGKHAHQTIDQSLIDYRRSQHGDPRTSSYSERKMAETRYIAPEDNSNGHRPCDYIVGSDPRELKGDRTTDKPLAIFLAGRDCEIFEKYIEDEMTAKEIGLQFGITESRVVQILTRAKAEVERWLLLQKMRDRAEAGMTELEIDWITF